MTLHNGGLIIMGWVSARALSAVLLSASFLFVSCNDDDDDVIVLVDDVTVEVTGDPGVEFDGFVEDDNGSRLISGVVPLTEDHLNQVGFFAIQLDKTSAGTGQLCVRATSSHFSDQDCTTASAGTVRVSIVF
jgi:hypothetical protein